MASFALSPSVTVREIDLTTVVPQVATSQGALAGVFRWGPLEELVLVDSEDYLAQVYGKPTNLNPETWFTAASFLGYTNLLYISRAADVTGNNVTKTFIGNSINHGTDTDNNFVKTTNNVGIIAGMVILFSNTDAIPVGAGVASVNSTGIVLDQPVTANVDALQIVLRENITWTAVAQQSDIDFDATDVNEWAQQIIKNKNDYVAKEANGHLFDSSVLYVARYPGEIGNSLRIAVCDSPDQFRSNTDLGSNVHYNPNSTNMSGNVGSNSVTFTFTPNDVTNATSVAIVNAAAADVLAELTVGDLLEFGNTRIGFQFLQVTEIDTLSMTGNIFSFSVTTDDELRLSANTHMRYMTRYWEFYRSFRQAPVQSDYVLAHGNTAANDELHVAVIDELGKFTGNPQTVLEIYPNVSRAIDAKSADGSTIYYKNIINNKSRYIWWANDRTTAISQTAPFVASSDGHDPLSMFMIGGADGLDEQLVSFGTIAFAYDRFRSAEDIDISLVMTGKARGEPVTHYTQLANYINDNITQARMDCLGFCSPDIGDVVNNKFEELNSVVDFANNIESTSYLVIDSGYKYIYDKYNDLYRWCPLNGDIAGLCARTDHTNDAWWSPAGLNRGFIKNSIYLAYNPRRAERDILYTARVNPVITTPGLGTYLFGDKTALAKSSAFDRINVRRLFIVLEKAISTAAKYTLFEFNDDFTRAQFRNLVNPYLRDVQARRGLYDFLVVCDTTNNTPEVIDDNEFIADIYLKPARSINFILLNFVAVRTGVAFSEVVGKF